MTPEGKFKRYLIKKIERQYPGAIVLKNDAAFLQGIPDHLILYNEQWAAFEAKADLYSIKQKNQEYYVNLLNEMSYAVFVCPENEERFFDELQHTFRVSRPSRIFGS